MTVKMLDDFRASLEPGSPDAVLLGEIEAHLATRPHRSDGSEMERDVETVLETITFLEDTKIIAHPFLAPQLASALQDPDQLAHLRISLQRYIRSRCLIRQSDLEPLRAFTRFLRIWGILEVFTVNYDIVTELLCDLDNVAYSDGFQLNWQPSDFERDEVKVRLHKLHGSVTWFESPSEKDLKVPLRLQEPRVERLSGEIAYPLMMYPAQKLNDSTVFLTLHSQLHNALRSHRWMVVAGFSFRDEHINKLFQEAARDRPELIFILISPGAERIYRKAILEIGARHDDSGEPLGRPLLERRVVRIPFKYERVLGPLADRELIQIQSAMDTYTMSAPAIVEGRAPRVDTILLDLIQAGLIDQAEEVEPYARVDRFTPEWNLTYGGIKAAVQASLARYREATDAWGSVEETLIGWFVRRLEVQINGPNEVVNLVYRRGGDDPPNPGQAPSMVPTFLRPIADFYARYANFCSGEEPVTRSRWFTERLGKLDGLVNYFEENARRPPTLDQLLAQRGAEFSGFTGPIVSRLSGLTPDQRVQERPHLQGQLQALEREFLMAKVFRLPLSPTD